MSKINRPLGSMTFSPVLWGVVASFCFVSAVRSGALGGPTATRFFASHGSAQLITALFFIGLATLLLRALRLGSQRQLLGVPLLDAIPAGGQALAECDTLLNRLDEHPASIRDSYLIRRLREVLEYVFRKGSADTIEDEMRYRANVDRARLHENYAFLRRLVGATFAAGVLAAAVTAADAAAEGLPLNKAWDVLALGGAMGVLLLFGMHALERVEMNLLSEVDARVSAELVGRFELSFNPAAAPEIAILRGMGEQVTRSTEQLVERQVEIWKASFAQAQQQWSKWSAGATQQLQDALAVSLAQTMQQHAATLSAAAITAAEQNATRWSEVQQALLQNAEAVTLQQRELVKQGEVLMQVVGATGQVEKLESELNRNLSTLAGAKNFEQTVLSLGAAIQLLNAKLGSLPTPETPQVQLKAKRGAKAA